eukprot:TRINITY_DN78_c1_g1_i1.p1 TRINITY_DN78_c1_g1~~TRINITY_DN78_c1_g1_i1.p1  ORF type:complete len:295 (+),score=11.78 TRINITY_DN78_c1_g1_i1:75-959(+)
MTAKFGIVLALLFAIDFRVDSYEVPVVGESYMAQRKSAHQFILEDSKDTYCEEYCNGELLLDLDSACYGVLSFECVIDDTHFIDQCLGQYNRTVSDDDIDILCNGLFTQKYTEFSLQGSFECGGEMNLIFKVDEFTPAVTKGPITQTCSGTSGYSEYDPYSLYSTLMSMMSSVDVPLKNVLLPPGFTCKVLCNGLINESPLCHGLLQASCLGSIEQGTIFYECRGVFYGGYHENACAGYVSIIRVGLDFSSRINCSEAFGYKRVNETVSKSCQGVYTYDFDFFGTQQAEVKNVA